MARQKNGVNKSEEIRQLLRANPSISISEITAALDQKGIKATEGLIYFVKGKMKGRKARRKKAQTMVAKVAETTGKVDALSTILKVKDLASQVGGLKKLKALIEALSA
jgi:hypothetical protein